MYIKIKKFIVYISLSLLTITNLIYAGGVDETSGTGPIVSDYLGRKIRISNNTRIVPLGGAVTEIVYGLGMGENVVGIDISATYPKDVLQLPVVGYQRRITAEGVLSVNPTLVIATTESGPVGSLDLIRNSGVTVLILPEIFTIEGTKDKIYRIGTALNRKSQAAKLIEELEFDLKSLEELRNKIISPKRVLFIYARGTNVLMAAGRNNQADELIKLAGGTNAGSGFFGFRPLTAESVIAANPEVVLMLTKGKASIGGDQGILKLPGINFTEAGKQNNFIDLEDNYLLGFGPRLGKAISDLVVLLHPEVNQL